MTSIHTTTTLVKLQLPESAQENLTVALVRVTE